MHNRAPFVVHDHIDSRGNMKLELRRQVCHPVKAEFGVDREVFLLDHLAGNTFEPQRKKLEVGAVKLRDKVNILMKDIGQTERAGLGEDFFYKNLVTDGVPDS